MTAKKPRTITEYRVLVKRVGNSVKDWRAHSLKSVERRIGLLTSPEPWRFYGDGFTQSKGPDDYVCCAGTVYDECACGGLTMREATEEKRRHLPPIEWIRVEQRQVVTTPWVLERASLVGAVDPVAPSAALPDHARMGSESSLASARTEG